MDCGNLESVAHAVKEFAPNAELVFLADNDINADGSNPGIEAATTAACAFGGRIAVAELDGRKCDFWDVWGERGSEAVARAIAEAKEVITVTAAPNIDEWPEPQPLIMKAEPAPYPLDALPDTIRAAVVEVHQFVKAPIALVASSALGALSLAGQAHVDVKRAEKLAGPVSLFLLTIADSGERKSTCDEFFTGPIREFQQQRAEAAKPDLVTYRADLAAWETKQGGIKDKLRQQAKASKPTAELESALRDIECNKPQAPRVARLLRGDDTPENLAWALMHEWPSGGVVSSEAALILGAHGMGKDSIMRNLGLLNILWDGGHHAIGRRTSESFTVKGARLTVALQVQEATLRSFFDRSGGLARGTGFLARFLIAWPESTQGFRPFTDAPPNWLALAQFNRRVASILDQPVAIDDDGALSPPALTLASETKAAWAAFHDAIESELASDGELFDVRDVASKSADNAARMAALFQVFEHGMGGAVGLDAFEGASRIVAWHLNESRRFFGELALPVELANAARLDKWLLDYCRRGRTNIIPAKKVQQYGPGGLRQKTAMDTAMRELEELGRARFDKDGRRRNITVNPVLLKEGGAA
jgi:putative DNA primase/helicase